MRPRSVLAAGLLAASLSGCFRQVRGEPRATLATCESACQHYVECRQSSDPTLDRSCLDECQAIFVTDGVSDEGSLREFEALDCYDTIAFVEGPSGRHPGERHDGPGDDATHAADVHH